MTGAGAVGVWSTATLWVVFVAGLTGGFAHCIGMCGPFVAASGLAGGTSGRTPARAGLFQLGYHAGRLTTYTAIGAVLGALGSAGTLEKLGGPAWITPLQRYLGLAAGVLMLVVGLAMLGVPRLERIVQAAESGAGAAGTRWFGRAYAKLAAAGWKASFPLGLLLGLLPCGFLLGIEAYALASGSAVSGALTMLVFGLGTVPALAGFGVVSGLVGARLRGMLTYAGAALVVALGVFAVVRGLVRVGAITM